MSIAAAILMFLCTVISGAVLVTGGRKRRKRQGYIVIPYGSDTEDLEMAVRSCCFDEQFDSPLRARDIFLVRTDSAADPAEAQRIAEKCPTVRCLEPEELLNVLMKDRSLENE